MKNKILIIGSGGREHSLAWKLAQSPKVEKIYIAPGNAGTAQVGENVAIPATDIGGLLQFAQKNNIDLTVVGPDDPLAIGVVDVFREKGLKIFGPTKGAAQIEASKVFAKNLMQHSGIPTASYKTFTDYNQALEYVKKNGAPIVIKASGLALGKGVAVCQTLEEAEEFLRQVMVDKIFGDSGSEVVVEEFLQGKEFSAHAISDGKTFLMFPPSQDHKPVFDGGKGHNTGGMGTIAPLPWVTEENMSEIKDLIVEPALKGLKEAGRTFTGLLYPGLIMSPDGPKVIEFNARFGDPECESYMRLLKSDLFDVLNACAEDKLSNVQLEWHEGFACCIMLASGGYPSKYEKGKPITGIEEAEKLDGVVVFHAGTTIKDNQLVTNGGRVLGVTATDDSLKGALDKAYAAVKLINFEGVHYRTDIGQQSL